MAALDKVLEDAYTLVKTECWGIPLVVPAVLLIALFSLWNSLPTST
jgi:hypothetical protein